MNWLFSFTFMTNKIQSMKFSLLTFVLLPYFIFAQLSSETASNITWVPNDNNIDEERLFVFCGNSNNTFSNITATHSNNEQNLNFYWELYNEDSLLYSQVKSDLNTSESTLDQLDNGYYRVLITNQNDSLLEIYGTWVYFDELTIAINPQIETLCDTVCFKSTKTNNTMKIRNTTTESLVIDSNTVITICFDANHTYVSDLGFFIIGPEACGSPRIELAPYPGSNNPLDEVCNSGDNLSNFCFSTYSTNDFYVCDEETPLTGIWKSYDNWNALYGCTANIEGWTVQIFDCISEDVGELTNASLTFTNSNHNYSRTIFYDSGVITAPIADMSCADSIAATHTYVFPNYQEITVTLSNQYNYSWYCADTSVIILNSTTPEPKVVFDHAGEYWIYASITDTIGNCQAVDSVFYTYAPTFTPQDISYNFPYLSVENQDLFYTWFFNDSLFDQGQALHQIKPTENGVYSVVATNDTCYSDTSFFVFLFSDIDYYFSEKNVLNIFPNPISEHGKLNIESIESGTLDIYNLDGVLAKSISLQKGLNTEFINLSKGTYIFSYQSETSTSTLKVIID